MLIISGSALRRLLTNEPPALHQQLWSGKQSQNKTTPHLPLEEANFDRKIFI